MATDFRYADITTLTKYFNRVNDYDSKFQIFPTGTAGNIHSFADCGYVTRLFLNSVELGDAESDFSTVNADGRWIYQSSNNTLYYYNCYQKLI